MTIIRRTIQISIIIGFSQQCLAQSNATITALPPAYKSVFVSDLTNILYASQGLLALKASNLINSQSNDCIEFAANGICAQLGARYTQLSSPKIATRSIVLNSSYQISNQWHMGAYIDAGHITSQPSYTNVKQKGEDPILGVYSVYKDKIWGAPYNFRLGANTGSTSLDISTSNLGNLGSLSRNLNIKAQSYLAILSTHIPVDPKVVIMPYLGTTYTTMNIDGSNNNSSKLSNLPIIFNGVSTEIFALQLGLNSVYRPNDSILLAATAGIQHTLSSNISNMTISSLPDLSGYTGKTVLANNVPTFMALAKYKTYKNQELTAKIIYRQEVYQRIGVTSYNLNYSIGF
jgi:hypothetical protein